MTHNEGVVDSNEPAHHDDDPGAYPFPFGKFAGKRLDTVPNGLRWWATRARQSNSWYAAYIKANKRYEELLLQTPEAYPFPFGEHDSEGKRLDGVSEDLIWWGVHPSRSHNAWYQSLVEANRLYLDKVYEKKTPGSVQIWFGERYKGYRLDDVYKRPGFIRFCLRPEHNTCPWVQRYEVHLQTHRRPYRPRAPAHVENPTGELLGKWDDDRGSAEPDDDYERDGFVVDDDDNEEEIYQEEGSDFQSTNNTEDPAVDDDSDEQDEQEHGDSEHTANSDADGSAAETERLSPSHASARISQSSASCLTRHKKRMCPSNDRRRSYRSSGEESDATDKPPQKRLKRRSEHTQGHRLVRRSARTDSHSDADSTAAADEPETLHHDQLSQSISALSLSQESATSPSDDDELSHAPRRSPPLQGKPVRRDDDDSDIPQRDIHRNAPSRLGRRYRALVQSDAEEL
ncbi:hypothetical protein DFH29DRAFT_964307 [Suillus ampliporus]|nr:hypothetical protein DFH29DRAFT_964307 [Suillus ampliporus]